MSYSDIFSRVRTTEEADELIRELDTVISNLFRVPPRKDILAESIREALAKEHILLTDHQKVVTFLNSMREKLNNLKVFGITLAFEPTGKTIDLISSWVRQNLGPLTILKIDVDPSIIAGSIVDFEGKYADGSLRKKLDEVFEEEKYEIGL